MAMYMSHCSSGAAREVAVFRIDTQNDPCRERKQEARR
jgi:hypothetical protein